MVPHRIHQIWFQGEKHLPQKYFRYQQSWKTHHPSWSYQLWDQELIERFLSPDELPLYSSLPLMIQKIDFAKYVILRKLGGVYVDMDMECLRPLDPLFSDSAKVYLSSLPFSGLPLLILTDFSYSDGPFYNNAFLASVPSYRLWTDLLHEMKKALQRKWFTRDLYVNHTTGPSLLTKVVRSGNYEIKVFPPHFFEPCDKYHFDKCDLSKSYAVHYYDNTWMSSPMKFVSFLYYHWTSVVFTFLLLLVLVCLILLPR